MTVVREVIGRITVLFDNLIRVVAGKAKGTFPRADKSDVAKYESTGIHVERGSKPKTIDNDCNIVMVDYDDLSHRLWRAQELTIISCNKEFLRKPILDLGCGDGSFASVLFQKIDYGVDPDPIAVGIASIMGIYDKTLNTLAEETGLPNSSVGSVFSNSVLEHTINLGAIIEEVARILKPNGVFMFTVPNWKFNYIMKKYFGKREAERLNERVFYHRNLLTNVEWVQLLEKRNFCVEKVQNYQSEQLSFVFRMLRSPFLKRLNNVVRFWDDKFFLKLVSESLAQNKGGGTFILARKQIT